jgi:hypothetical protein
VSQPLVIGVYVDDLLITGPMDEDIVKFKRDMQEQFLMSGLYLLTYNLGIEVCQDSSRITSCQSSYARKLHEKTGMLNCNPSSTPMEPRLQLIKKSSVGLVNATEY